MYSNEKKEGVCREPVLLRNTCHSALWARLVCLLAIVPSTNLKPKPKPKHQPSRPNSPEYELRVQSASATSAPEAQEGRLGSSSGWPFMSTFLYANTVVDSTISKGKGADVETYVQLLSSTGARPSLKG